jgi:hypothetical protein
MLVAQFTYALAYRVCVVPLRQPRKRTTIRLMNDQTPNDTTPPLDDEESRFAPSAEDAPELPVDDAPEGDEQDAPAAPQTTTEPEDTSDEAEEPEPLSPELPPVPEVDDTPDPLSVDADELDALASELDALGLGYAATEPEGTLTMEATSSLPAAPGEGIALGDEDDAPVVGQLYRAERRDFPAYDPPSELDVDSALSAVTGLDSVIARQEAEEQVFRDEEARLEDILANPMPRPEPLVTGRGRPLSLLPGLAFVALGAYLTFAYSTDAAPPPITVAAMLVGVFALMLVLAWVGSGRWNRGTLFVALWGLFSAIGVYLASELLGTGVTSALVIALGAAFLLSGAFARPVDGGMVLVGLMFLVGGAVALAYALALIPVVVLTVIGTGWYVIAGLAALIVLLPAFRRLRG